MQTILVTGGAGFIGSNIAEALLARDYRVVVLDDLSTGRLDTIDHLLHNSHFTFIRGTVLDRGLLRSIMKTYQVSGISHQAAIASVTKSIVDPVRSVEANITGTTNIFDIAAESRCKRVVFASSCAVYGDGPETPKQEQQSLDPKSPYAVTKAAKEMLARTFCQLHDIEIIGLRYFNVYGRRQNPTSDYAAVVPAFITRALRNEPLPVEGDGRQTRDFVYIDDVVQANLLGLTASRNASGACYNIGSGVSISILELAHAVLKGSGSSSLIAHRPARTGDVRDSRADIGLSRTVLRYEPLYALEKGLMETIAWYRGKVTKKASPAVAPAPEAVPVEQ